MKEENDLKYSSLNEYYTVWAHQIKTPIAAMKLRLQNEDSAMSRELSVELSRIESYTDAVLCIIRLDSDSTDYVFKEYEIDMIIKQAVRKFSMQFILKKIKLEYSSVGFTAVTDEKWLTFVLEQIISNALKYTSDGGSIFIFAQGKTVCIKDTGIGINGADLPRIFENGYTGDNGRFDKSASGIGLYLCRRICKNLGHEIYAESEKGKGTTIRIRLAQ